MALWNQHGRFQLLCQPTASDWITPLAVILSALGIWAASGVGLLVYSPRIRPASFPAIDHISAVTFQRIPAAFVPEPILEDASGTADFPAPPEALPEPPEPAQAAAPAPPQSPPPVRGSYIGDLAAAGYPGLSVDQLIAFKIHGITPEYVRGLQAAGFKPSPDQLVEMRIHGVTPEFAGQIKSAGFSNATVEQLIALRIHGATPEYVREIKNLGLGDPAMEQLVAMLIHGITPDYARDLKAAGLRGLNFDQLIAMRIHGVSAAEVREAQKHFKDLSIQQIIKLKQLGILPGTI